MASGVKISEEVKTTYEDMRSKHDHKFILLKIQDAREVVVDECGDEDCTFEDFKEKLEEVQRNRDARFAIYEMGSEKEEQIFVFISWIPDSSAIKARMIYSSTRSQVKKDLRGIQIDVLWTDTDDVTEEELVAQQEQYLKRKK